MKEDGRRWLTPQGLLPIFLISLFCWPFDSSDAIQLKTTSTRLTGVGAIGDQNSYVQNFISRPIHWPDIVLSSNRVEVIKNREEKKVFKPFSFMGIPEPKETTSNSAENDVNPASDTVETGDTIVEYFALSQFKVKWRCTTNKPGRLVFVSPDGVPGIAKDCVMDFQFDTAANEEATVVALTMEYTPESPLAVLATPALVVDNWLALNLLLPAAVDLQPLDSFRKLMGILYGIAGIAHFLDLFWGGSQLFTNVIGIPSFQNLDLFGQLYAILWCAAGPIAYFLSVFKPSSPEVRSGDKIVFNRADIGLVFYGIVEVVGAALSSSFAEAAPNVVLNASSVQAIVIAAWIYSLKKQQRLEPSSTD